MSDKYRLIIFPAIEVANRCIEFHFNGRIELETAEETASQLLLFIQDEMGAMKDYSNCFIKEQMNSDGEWEEVTE